jgi:PTS system nitrogen regulatory IIA component
MDMEQLAAYLQRDIREVGKLASRGSLPGHKVGGEWRFAKAEINHWIETQLPAYSEKQLTALEHGGDRSAVRGPFLGELLAPASVAVPFLANTKSSVLRELVKLAEQSWQVYDAEAILAAIGNAVGGCNSAPATSVARRSR